MLRLFAARDAGGAIFGWTLKGESDEIEAHNASGQLVSIRYASEKAQHFTYATGTSQLASISDKKDRTTRFGYDGQGRTSQIEAPSGDVYQHLYDEQSRLVQVVYPAGGADPAGPSRRYLYEDARNAASLTGIIDENGNRYATRKSVSPSMDNGRS